MNFEKVLEYGWKDFALEIGGSAFLLLFLLSFIGI